MLEARIDANSIQRSVVGDALLVGWSKCVRVLSIFKGASNQHQLAAQHCHCLAANPDALYIVGRPNQLDIRLAGPVNGSSMASGGSPKWRANVCPAGVRPPRQNRCGLKKSDAARSRAYAAIFTWAR